LKLLAIKSHSSTTPIYERWWAVFASVKSGAQGHCPSAVTWGGHQNAGDGGIDVRVALPTGAAISGYVPKAATGFQVKGPGYASWNDL
jgi:hypothetical protein